MNRLSSEDYRDMNVEELREELTQKMTVLNQALSDNQRLAAETRRLEKELAKSEADREALKKRLKASNDDAITIAAERDTAKKLAAALYEKLTYLSERTDIKAEDLKKVVSLYHAALDAVTDITVWPELGKWDFFEYCFDEAERRVLGSKKSSPQALNRDRLQSFIQRSMRKLKHFKSAMNTPEARENIRRTIEEFLLDLSKDTVPGYKVTPLKDGPDSYVFDIEIDPMWDEALRNKGL